MREKAPFDKAPFDKAPFDKAPFDKAQGGQALLVVILTMVVALTVGLSVVTRSITTVRITTAEEESQRAFSAAEAGIEQALKSDANVAGSFPENQSSYNAIVSAVPTNTFVLPGVTQKDESVQIWLSRYPGYSNPFYGNIWVYWGEQAEPCDNAALEVIVFSGSTISPTVSRYAVDPCSSRRDINSFEAPRESRDLPLDGKVFKHRHAITEITNGLIMRITPLYMGTSIGLVKGANPVRQDSLPSQGSKIESTGEVASGQQKVVRKIKVFQSYPSLPWLFDYAIFSGTNL